MNSNISAGNNNFGTLNRVDMTSQTYAHFVWAHMRGFGLKEHEVESLIWAYVKCIYVCEVISTPFIVHFTVERRPFCVISITCKGLLL